MSGAVSGVKRIAETVVVGGGVIGLCAATAIAARGRKVTVVSEHRQGEASPAAAGMLAPSVERSVGPSHAFAIAARDFYPGYLELLADATGIRVPINRLGVLQVALSAKGVQGLRGSMSPGSVWLDRIELAEMEPTLGHALGAVLNPNDGAVDNAVLMKALTELVEALSAIDRIDAAVIRVAASERGAVVETNKGDTIESDNVVLSPGPGAHRSRAPALSAVAPSRGQLVSTAQLACAT